MPTIELTSEEKQRMLKALDDTINLYKKAKRNGNTYIEERDVSNNGKCPLCHTETSLRNNKEVQLIEEGREDATPLDVCKEYCVHGRVDKICIEEHGPGSYNQCKRDTFLTGRRIKELQKRRQGFIETENIKTK